MFSAVHTSWHTEKKITGQNILTIWDHNGSTGTTVCYFVHDNVHKHCGQVANNAIDSATGKSVQAFEQSLNNDLQVIAKWCDENSMAIKRSGQFSRQERSFAHFTQYDCIFLQNREKHLLYLARKTSYYSKVLPHSRVILSYILRPYKVGMAHYTDVLPES